jgi:uncharacterized DUF497 family protein
MPVYLFVWTDENVEHLAENGVVRDEFEQVVCDPVRVESSRSTGRPIAFGYTSEGRFLACVYEPIDESTVYPITAYEVES